MTHILKTVQYFSRYDTTVMHKSIFEIFNFGGLEGGGQEGLRNGTRAQILTSVITRENPNSDVINIDVGWCVQIS